MNYFAVFFFLCVFGLGMAIGGIMAAVSKAPRDDADGLSKKMRADDEAAPRTEDASHRFPLDQRLRNAGYAIYARPAGGEPIWSKDGVEYTQGFALSLLGV